MNEKICMYGQKISLKSCIVFAQLEPGTDEDYAVITKEQFVKKYQLHKP